MRCSNTKKCILYHTITSGFSLFLLECTLTREGREYKGTMAVTKSGKQCQTWLHNDRYNNEDFSDATPEDAENFCRNPDSSLHGPWCFTSLDARTQSEDCNIPYCGDINITTGKKKAHTQLCCKHEHNG